MDPDAEVGRSGWLPTTKDYSLIAACRYDERALEVEPRPEGPDQAHGALTLAWCEASTSSTPDLTYRELYPALVFGVRSVAEHQHPQIEGVVDRLLYRHHERRPRHDALVLATRGDRLVLDVGALHGVAPGGEWTLHEATPNPQLGPPIARASTTLVTGTRADAVIAESAASAPVGPGSRALESRPGLEAPALTVRVPDDARRRELSELLRGAIEASPELQTANGECAVRVEVLGPRDGLDPRAMLPELGPLAETVAVLIDSRNRLVAPVLPLGEEARTVHDLVANLRALAHRGRITALDNPIPPPFRDQVSLCLLRRDGDGLWHEASDPGEPAWFRHRECFGVDVTNGSSQTVFAHLLSLGVGGSIDLLYPESGAIEALAPGRTLSLGQRQGGELFFAVPDFVPFASPGADGTFRGERLMLLVTTDPHRPSKPRATQLPRRRLAGGRPGARPRHPRGRPGPQQPHERLERGVSRGGSGSLSHVPR